MTRTSPQSNYWRIERFIIQARERNESFTADQIRQFLIKHYPSTADSLRSIIGILTRNKRGFGIKLSCKNTEGQRTWEHELETD